MKKTSLVTILYALSLFALVTGISLSLPVKAQTNSAATRVDVTPVVRQHTQNLLSVPATVAARNSSNISFGVAGRLASFSHDVGDRVDAGQPIAQLNQRQIKASIESLNARRQAAEATLQDEQQQLDELQSLAETNYAAQSELRRARAAVAVAQANLAEINATLNERQVALDYHQLTTPFDAIVAERSINVGEWVTEDQAVFQLVQRDDLHIDAYLAQRYLTQVDESTEVALQVNGNRLDASIATEVAYINPADRTFLLRLEPADPSALVVGSAVTAMVTLRSAQPQLTVPQDAVIRYSDGRTSVWVAESQNDGRKVARERLVDLGQRFNGWVAIGDSLEQGTEVVVRGNESLSDGEVLSTTLSDDYD